MLLAAGLVVSAMGGLPTRTSPIDGRCKPPPSTPATVFFGYSYGYVIGDPGPCRNTVEDGYCLGAADGGLFCFNDTFRGSASGGAPAPIVAVDTQIESFFGFHITTGYYLF